MKKIVFAMIEAGGGHKAPAQAVLEALNVARPGAYACDLMDFIKDVGAVKVDADHKRGWGFFLEHSTFTHLIFQVQNSLAPVTRAVLYRAMVAPAVSDALRFIRRYKPDLVFSTHFFASMALIEARRRAGMSFPIVTYLTEIFTFHAPWLVRESDWFITSSARAARNAAKYGIRPERIRTFPYPIRPSFLTTGRDRSVVSAELGLDAARPTILFSFGNQGSQTILQYLLALDMLGIHLNVLVATGHNYRLKSRLELGKSLFQRLKIVPLGFASNMNELIQAADICLIKPGPATMMECMHFRKPIVFGLAATPCEQAHANYAVSRGVAKYTEGNAMLFGMAVKHFLKEDVKASVAARYDALHLRNGAQEIAAFLDRVAAGDQDP
jgi:UDP-N-acetylglucosamine:LPS N-acetylglucosamine transferase